MRRLVEEATVRPTRRAIYSTVVIATIAGRGRATSSPPAGRPLPPIGRWQAGRSPRTLIVPPSGEAACPFLFHYCLGAGRPIRPASFSQREVA